MTESQTLSLNLSPKQLSWLTAETAGIPNFHFLEWMLANMTTTDTSINIRGNIIALKAGQMNGSVNSSSLHFKRDRAVIRELYAAMQQLGLIYIVPMGRVTTIIELPIVTGWNDAAKPLSPTMDA